MVAAVEKGSLVTMICDGGERYLDTYYNAAWLRERGFEIAPYLERLRAFRDTGRLNP